MVSEKNLIIMTKLWRVGRHFWRLPSPPPAQADSATAGRSGLCLVGCCLSPRMETSWPPWSTCASVWPPSLYKKPKVLSFPCVSICTHCLWSFCWVALRTAQLPPLLSPQQLFMHMDKMSPPGWAGTALSASPHVTVCHQALRYFWKWSSFTGVFQEFPVFEEHVWLTPFLQGCICCETKSFFLVKTKMLLLSFSGEVSPWHPNGQLRAFPVKSWWIELPFPIFFAMLLERALGESWIHYVLALLRN